LGKSQDGGLFRAISKMNSEQKKSQGHVPEGKSDCSNDMITNLVEREEERAGGRADHLGTYQRHRLNQRHKARNSVLEGETRKSRKKAQRRATVTAVRGESSLPPLDRLRTRVGKGAKKRREKGTLVPQHESKQTRHKKGDCFS